MTYPQVDLWMLCFMGFQAGRSMRLARASRTTSHFSALISKHHFRFKGGKLTTWKAVCAPRV